jgi:hypothetical protein
MYFELCPLRLQGTTRIPELTSDGRRENERLLEGF